MRVALVFLVPLVLSVIAWVLALVGAATPYKGWFTGGKMKFGWNGITFNPDDNSDSTSGNEQTVSYQKIVSKDDVRMPGSLAGTTRFGCLTGRQGTFRNMDEAMYHSGGFAGAACIISLVCLCVFIAATCVGVSSPRFPGNRYVYTCLGAVGIFTGVLLALGTIVFGGAFGRLVADLDLVALGEGGNVSGAVICVAIGAICACLAGGSMLAAGCCNFGVGRALPWQDDVSCNALLAAVYAWPTATAAPATTTMAV